MGSRGIHHLEMDLCAAQINALSVRGRIRLITAATISLPRTLAGNSEVVPDLSCRFKRSMQHLLGVYSRESGFASESIRVNSTRSLCRMALSSISLGHVS